MSLHEALRRRGYGFRQHLEEAGWTARKLTVVDLDDAQREALKRDGVEGLKKALDAQGLWSFPALDIDAPIPRRGDVLLAEGGEPTATVVAAGSLRETAQAFVETVAERSNVRLPLLADTEADPNLLATGHIVVFGGAHENRLAKDLALRYQTFFADAVVPGEGGWVVTTHLGLDGSGHAVMQVATSDARRDEALACLREAVSGDANQVLLRHTHQVSPGQEMREHLPTWEAFASRLPRRLPRFEGQSTEAPQELVPLSELIAKGLDSGGPDVNLYNAAPIDIAVGCGRYYQLSGDARGLQLFRELLFRLADYYLKTPEGASYPSDLDFRIGHLVLYYSRLEHDPVFSDEDRLILANLLLSCVRSAYEYTRKMWPIEPNAPTRHNHETFAARSLMFAAEYFGRYGVKDVADWREHADAIFSGGIWNRFKQKENANTYEQTAFEHAASYSAFTGRRLDLFGEGCLRQAAMRQVTATDNFFRPVDYGDTNLSMRNGVTDMLAILASCQQEDPTLVWYVSEMFRREHHYLSSPIHGIPGIRSACGEADTPSTRVWEQAPLDPRFREAYCGGFPEAFAFDKLAFRTGWEDDDHYLLFEGVGNRSISHSHNDVNGIVRLNHLGRHWVVSNGYGRRAGVTNINTSFNTRVRGPEDHNMLVLKHEGQVSEDLPPCSGLLQKGQSGDLAYATGVLVDYAGTDWFRTLLVMAGRFVLVVDRVHVRQSGLEAGHIEWNCPGSAVSGEAGYRLDQQGVFMDVSSASGWAPEQGVTDQSADWQRTIESGAYPYASFPLTKLMFRMPGLEAGRSACLATLLAVTRAPGPAYQVAEPEPGVVRVKTTTDPFPDLRVDNQDLSVRADGSELEVRFSEVPEVPESLRAWSANREK